MQAPLELTDLDRQIWLEELDAFVPQRVFDVHTHIYRWTSNTDPDKENSSYRKFLGDRFADAPWDLLDACDRILMPGREVHRLSFPFPFKVWCDFEASNRFIAEQVQDHPASAALMLVYPEMSDDDLDEQIEQHGFLGFKPYRFYSSTGDAVDCRITDFLPEHQIAVADRHGLLIMMHLAKRDAIADPENLADLQRLSDRYPNARWILAHCARGYSSWPIEQAASVLRRLPNVWCDVSSVCESDAIAALLETVGPERVMYGSDDVPVGVLRGKYISFGRAWAYLSETNHSLDLSHCRPEMTFTRYEQLRAMHRAAKNLALTQQQIEAIFHDTAAELVNSVRTDQASEG